MNKQPVSYLQNDPRWADKPYYSTGAYNTIGVSGCGPTCAAMLISTLTGKEFTPEQACNWAVDHGHRSKDQGTYYRYFTAQFEEFGIACRQLNWSDLRNSGGKSNQIHEIAFDLLRQGYYLIAVMGEGLWTRSGHFVVVWWEDGKVRINDPASSRPERLNGDLDTFKSQVKYYWAIDAQDHNDAEEEEDVVRYNKLSDIPENSDFRKIIDILMTAGIIAGDGSDSDGNDDVIDLSHDMVRMLIFNYRAGCYDEAILMSGHDPDLYK